MTNLARVGCKTMLFGIALMVLLMPLPAYAREQPELGMMFDTIEVPHKIYWAQPNNPMVLNETVYRIESVPHSRDVPFILSSFVNQRTRQLTQIGAYEILEFTVLMAEPSSMRIMVNSIHSPRVADFYFYGTVGKFQIGRYPGEVEKSGKYYFDIYTDRGNARVVLYFK